MALPVLTNASWHGLPAGLQLGKPQVLLPNITSIASLTREEKRVRDEYFKELLIIVVLLSMFMGEFFRISITAARRLCNHRRGYQTPGKATNSLESVPEKALVSAKCAVLWHASYQLACAGIVAVGLAKGAVSDATGLDWELWLVWLSMNMLDMILQTILRTSTAHVSALGWAKLVCPSFPMAVLPGFNDRSDIMLDIVFTGLCMHHGGVMGVLLAALSIITILRSSRHIYSFPSLQKELRADFLSVLEPADPDAIGLGDAIRDDLTFWQFVYTQAVKSSSPMIRSVVWREDVPQSILKCLYIWRFAKHSGKFMWISVLIGIVKLVLLTVMSMGCGFMVVVGTPLQLLRRLSSHYDMGDIVLAWPALRRVTDATEISQEQWSLYLQTFDYEDKVKIFVSCFCSWLTLRRDTKLFAAIRNAALEDSVDEALEVLGRLLRDSESVFQVATCRAMANAAPPAKSPQALDLLLPMLSHSQISMRSALCIAIAEVAPEKSAEMTQVLQAMLQSSTASKVGIVEALLSVACAPPPDMAVKVTQLLPPMLRDEDERVRATACYAIAGAWPSENEAEALQLLAPMLQDSSVLARFHACQCIGYVSSPTTSAEALRLLAPVLQDPARADEWMVTHEAYFTVGLVATPETAEEALQLLAPIERHRELGVRAQFAMAHIRAKCAQRTAPDTL